LNLLLQVFELVLLEVEKNLSTTTERVDGVSDGECSGLPDTTADSQICFHGHQPSWEWFDVAGWVWSQVAVTLCVVYVETTMRLQILRAGGQLPVHHQGKAAGSSFRVSKEL
jgi:hypothetical protein